MASKMLQVFKDSKEQPRQCDPFACAGQPISIMGDGVKAKSRLGPDFGIAALQLWKARQEDQEPYANNKLFEADCQALRVVEFWRQTQLKRFGTVASLSPAFKRVVDGLMTKGGV